MDNFVIGTIQENIKTLSSELQILNSNTPSKLSDLSDVSAVTPADGDTLVYNATDDIFEPKAQSGGSGGSSITELDDIPGVTILNVQNNQFLKYDSGEWINSNITDNDTDNLSDLTDTLLTTPFGNDEVLKYLNGKWVNGNIPIEKLSNVYISNLQDGETLRYVQQNTRWENVNNIDTLNELSDVTISSNLNNQVLKYNNSLGVYKNDFLNLTDLGDTNITTLANGNILIYNNGVWSAGNITYTNGTGVSITDNKIIIGQSVGTTDDVQFAEVICDEISTNTISERTTGGGITITGSVNMTGIPESANSNKLLYNIITGQITHQADTGGNGGGADDLTDLTDTEIITPQNNQVLKYLNGKWKNMEVGSVGVPAPPVISTEFALPANVLADYDFRTYTLSGANVIDSDGDVIFTTIGSGNISFTSAEGVYTSSDPDRYLSKSDGLLPIPSGNFSLEFYIKFGPITTNVDHVFFQYNAGADITLEGFIGQDGKLYFQTRNGPNNLRLVYFDPFDTEATLANWDSTNFNHFVITWDGSGTEKLYHDGSLVTKNLTQYSGNVSYGQNLTFATLYLGGAFPGVPRDNIDDTIKFHRLYDGALSPVDVSYLFDNREVSGVFKDVTNYALVSNNATGTETRWVSAATAGTAGTAGAAGTVCKIHILPFTDDETADVNSNTYTDTVSKTFTKTTGTNLFGEVHINYTIDGSGADSFQARLKFSDNPSITGDDYDIAYYGYIGGGGGGGDINGVAAYTDGTGTSNAGSQGIYLQARCIDSGDTITFKNGFFKVTEIWA